MCFNKYREELNGGLKMENEITIASRKSRIFAFIIDYAILNFVALALIALIIIAGEKENDALMFSSSFGGFILLFLIFGFKDTFKGQSIGKRLIGIAVRKQENQNETPSVLKLFLRNLTHVLGWIEFIVLAVDKDKQRLGDKLAKTVVVKTKEMSVLKKTILIISAIVLSIAVMVVPFVSFVMFFKNSEAYKVSEEYILQDETIIRETGGIEGFGFLPSGSINATNVSGDATLTIKVIGKEKDIYVGLYLTKEPKEDWYIQEVEYYE
jgi:uncharacterized RDD family membrane protein YckC